MFSVVTPFAALNVAVAVAVTRVAVAVAVAVKLVAAVLEATAVVAAAVADGVTVGNWSVGLADRLKSMEEKLASSLLLA